MRTLATVFAGRVPVVQRWSQYAGADGGGARGTGHNRASHKSAEGQIWRRAPLQLEENGIIKSVL